VTPSEHPFKKMNKGGNEADNFMEGTFVSFGGEQANLA
jgi:hypothetical protein